jgi:hydrogenase maturation protein HypF
VIWDGTGFGSDGHIWGGEFLIGDYRAFRRAARLRYVPMPGGAQAIREPWRMGLAYLADAQAQHSLPRLGAERRLGEQVPASAIRRVIRMIERQVNAPITSSAGRLFDAVAAVAGVCGRVSYEGQAAMQLEWVSMRESPDGTYPFELAEQVERGATEPIVEIDTRPLLTAIAADAVLGVAPGKIGRRFHSTLVEAILQVVLRIHSSTGLQCIVLSGGVFLNVLLLEEVTGRLEQAGFQVYRHRRVPPNDAGLSLGQLAIAAAAPS